ncbi:MAG: hypothetical protein WBB42_01080 [Polyangiales bacterium]
MDRIFARPRVAQAREAAEVAGHPAGHVGVVTQPIGRIAGFDGALVAIIAIDARAQHAATGAAVASNAAIATDTADATSASDTAYALYRGCAARLGAIDQAVRIVVGVIVAVPCLRALNAEAK